MTDSQGNIAGNLTDKYHSENPLVRLVMDHFLATARDLLVPKHQEIASVLEAGCGEGHLSVRLARWGFSHIRACDVSADIILAAGQRYRSSGITFFTRSVLDLDSTDDADLVVCAEVLEHLDRPEEALRSLALRTRRYALLSVPNEPWFRMMNVLRGKYLLRGGNTPGHIQHWSTSAFVRLVSRHYRVLNVRQPFPWTMVLAAPLPAK